ncbi:MAG TPA: ribosome maturation factor RimM [Steroidobacteraceae bacterium]|nr:ribosome maturation factor RimM [Steroidobacteraceae bacterium]
MGDEPAPLVELGAVTAPYGVKGWVKVRSDTQPAERLLEYRCLRLLQGGSAQVYRIEASGQSGGQLTLKFAGVSDRNQALGLSGASICVPRSELPARADRDYYRADLIGCGVVNLGGEELGTVAHFVETPAHAVMVVRGAKEYWVPAVPKHLRRVDLQARRLLVDWVDAAE